MADVDIAEIKEACGTMLDEAKAAGVSEYGHERLRQMVGTYPDIFRVSMGPDPPADIPPLVITLKDNARPVRATQRRYSQPQVAFINAKVKELVRVGALFLNPNSKWASPIVAAPKPGSTEGFRFTVDLRAPNAQTIPMASAMPNLEAMLQAVEGSSYYAKVDLCHAYWQLPLAKESQECMSIQTPLGVHTPTRTLQGSTDAGNNFQASTSEVFRTMHDHLLQWIDDFVLHATTEQELLDLLEEYFRTCDKVGLKIHAQKSSLFAKEVKFCGRIIDGDGIRFDPSRLETLLNMQRPTKAGDLLQFNCATNWMRSSIPNYSHTMAPLQDLMEKVYKAKGKRTRRAVATYDITDLWGGDEEASFQTIQLQLANAVRLAHPKSGHTLCLFTDASDTHWSGILTQVPADQMDLPTEEQDHQPLAFQSGAFKGASERWSTVEKEGYALVESLDRFDFLVAGRELSLFTDHANLI
jgi:RNase H-like domain found in reverse transcriptase/Reverse transcriptase (RNA-dependent DNA polymerase)